MIMTMETFFNAFRLPNEHSLSSMSRSVMVVTVHIAVVGKALLSVLI